MVILVCSIILVINIVLWIFCFRLIRKELSVKGTIEEVKKEVNNLITEINQETDRDITLMEAKCTQIKNLIDSVDKKILMYEHTIIQKENEKELLKQLSDFDKQNNSAGKNSAERGKTSSKLYSEYLPLFTEFAGTEETNPSLGKGKKSNGYPVQQNLDFKKNEEPSVEKTVKKETKPENSLPGIIKTDIKVEPKVPVTDQILKLASEGFTPELIAGKLNLSISEVSMTIDLYM